MVLAICILARLAGKVGPLATSRYAQKMTQNQLRTLGAWRHAKGRYVAPSLATIHRVMTETDPEALQAVTHRWVTAQLTRQPLEALAADGKRINGANRNSKEHFETVILVRHQDAVPIAVRSCRDQGDEQTAMAALVTRHVISGNRAFLFRIISGINATVRRSAGPEWCSLAVEMRRLCFHYREAWRQP